MKAKISKENLETLLKIPGQKDFLIKKDKYFSFLGEPLSKPKHLARIREEYKTQCTILSVPYFFDFTHEMPKESGKVFLTIKEKHTDSEGIETNVEKESEMENTLAIEALFNMVNFKPYFEKEKRAISFYANQNGYFLHLEIVSVNNSDLYLEVETFTEDEKAIPTLQNVIKKFFKETLNISEFDGRNWNEIISNPSQRY